LHCFSLWREGKGQNDAAARSTPKQKLKGNQDFIRSYVDHLGRPLSGGPTAAEAFGSSTTTDIIGNDAGSPGKH
jgi:hypothetical protein